MEIEKQKLTLIQARKMAGFTQQQMADRLGVSKSTYRQYERHPGKMMIDKAWIFSGTVGVKLDDLLWK